MALIYKWCNRILECLLRKIYTYIAQCQLIRKKIFQAQNATTLLEHSSKSSKKSSANMLFYKTSLKPNCTTFRNLKKKTSPVTNYTLPFHGIKKLTGTKKNTKENKGYPMQQLN